MKKILSFIFVLTMIAGCIMPVAYADDVAVTPVAITTAAEFKAMTATGSYYLANDIDFDGEIFTNCVVEDFSGTLDGKGYKIHNFSIVGGTDDTGVFKYIAMSGDASIKDLTVGTATAPILVSFNGTATCAGVFCGAQNSKGYKMTVDNVTVYGEFSFTQTTANKHNVAGFFGATQNCEVTNCKFYGSVSASTSSRWINVAGIAANTKNNSSIFINCVNYGDITSEATTDGMYPRAAGIVADNSIGTTTQKCINYGKIEAKGTNSDAGGIFALTEKEGVYIEDCINFGDVTADKYAGGILGRNCKPSVLIERCINYGKTTVKTGGASGEICGYQEAELSIVEDNFDKSAGVPETLSENLKGAAVQCSAPSDGRMSVRFVSSINALEYKSVGFDVDVYYMAKRSFECKELDMSSKHVFEKIKSGDGEFEAASLGGSYLIAHTLGEVPADEDSGNIIFVARPYAKQSDGSTVWGEAFVAIYNAGALVSIDLAGK